MIDPKTMMEIFEHLHKHDSPWVRRYLTYNNISEEDRQQLISTVVEKAMQELNVNPTDETAMQTSDTLLMALVHAGVRPFEIVKAAFVMEIS